MCAKSFQLCLTLCDPMGCSPPGPSVHGILQARILEWVAMTSSRGTSQPRDRTHVSYLGLLHGQAGSLPLVPPGKPLCFIMNSSHSQFYSLFYYLSDTYGDCPQLGGFCHSVAWTAKKVPWSMCVPLPLAAAWAHQWVTWPPWLLLPPRRWASLREAAAVGGFDELHGLCVSSVLWSHPLWWVCLSQKLHFWELKALNTFPSSPLLGVDLNIQSGSDFYPFLISLPTSTVSLRFPSAALRRHAASLPLAAPGFWAGEGAPPVGGASPGSCFESLPWAEQLRKPGLGCDCGGGCCPLVSFVWFSYITKREERAPASPLSSCSSCLSIWGESAGFPGFSLANPNCNQYFPQQFVCLLRPFPSLLTAQLVFLTQSENNTALGDIKHALLR